MSTMIKTSTLFFVLALAIGQAGAVKKGDGPPNKFSKLFGKGQTDEKQETRNLAQEAEDLEDALDKIRAMERMLKHRKMWGQGFSLKVFCATRIFVFTSRQRKLLCQPSPWTEIMMSFCNIFATL